MQRDFTLGAVVVLRQAEDPYCTRYEDISNIPLSWTWSKIAKGTPILIIALTGRMVSGSDVRIRHRDWQVM